MADGAEAPEPAIPWREGLWEHALRALIKLRADRTSAEYRRALQDQGVGVTVRGGQATLRMQRLSHLALLVDGEPEGAEAAAESAAADYMSASVPGISKGLPLTGAAIADPVLAEQPLTEAEIAELRALTVEDFSFVFGFRLMAECALRIGIFLLRLAKQEERFDDFWIALRLGDLLADIVEPDDRELLQFRCTLLAYLPELPVLSTEDATDRVELARRLTEAIREAVCDPPPEEVRELLDPSRALEPETLAIGGGAAARAAAAARLSSAHARSGNAAYLEDLIRLHEAVVPGETDLEKARRLRRLARALHTFGVSTSNAAAFGSAAVAQGKATEVLRAADSEQPLGDYLLDSANFYLASLILGEQAVAPRLDVLRAFVPPLPASEDDEPIGIAAAHGTRAVFELAAALEEPGREGETLDNALAAAELAERMLASEEGHPAGEIEALLACARVLSAVRGSHLVEADDARGLVLALDRHKMDPIHRLALVTGREAIGSPPARLALREALLPGECRGDALALLVELVLADGDLDGEPGTRAAAIEILSRFVTESSAAEGGDRALGDRARIEGAVQLASAGHLEEAVALYAFRGGEVETPPEGSGSAHLCLLRGERELVLLKRLPDGPWELASHLASGDKSPLCCSWLADDVSPEVAWEGWLDALAEPLTALTAEPLRELQGKVGSPLLCFDSGLPLPLVSWTQHDVEVRIAQVSGMDGADIRERLTAPLLVESLVAFIGDDQDGTYSVTLEMIGDAGFTTDKITIGPEMLAQLRAAEAIHCASRTFQNTAGLGLPIDGRRGIAVRAIQELGLDRTRLVTLLFPTDPESPPSIWADVTESAEAFLGAGAGVVLATTAPTPKAALDIFTPTLYSALGQGAPIDAAYARAIGSIRKSRSLAHPANWAGITLFTGCSRSSS